MEPLAMPRNPIQFQRGLSMADFRKDYDDEDRCWEALRQARWPDGFMCPNCGANKYSFLVPKRLFQCSACGKQTSVRAGTIFHHSKLPLRTWFLAIYCLTQTKNSVAALELMRTLGVQYNTAWLMKQKIMQVMHERNEKTRLEGRIEMDDAYLGGEKEGKPGRGSQNKLPFVAAVETREGRPQRLQFRRVEGFTKHAIATYAKVSIAPGSEVVSDGLSCFEAVTEAGCTHKPFVTSRIHRSQKLSIFRWVNTALGNLKNAIRGTFHTLSDRHAARHLAEFEYRFNRRSDLAEMIPRLLRAALTTQPRPYRWLVPTEANA
jgi:transposase-like protein